MAKGRNFILRVVFLLVVFISYWTGITLFTHSHVIDGVVISHSHPYHGPHSHSKVQLETISFISAYTVLEDILAHALPPLILVLLCIITFVERPEHYGKYSGWNNHLRAPPAICRY